MELEVQKFQETGTDDGKGGMVVSGGAKPVGPVKKFEFGAAGDNVTLAVKGSYSSHWNPDFLQKEMGKKGLCARFYFDSRIAVDIADPESKRAEKKTRLCHENGFAYLCIPEDHPQNLDGLKKLVARAIKDYYDYEEDHPRPVQIQEAVMIDEKGTPRNVKVTAIDTKVGGGIIGGSLADALKAQEAELKAARSMTKKELRVLEQRSVLMRALRRAREAGEPFRNPFVAKGVRKYRVAY